jgi:hypothetical protein
VNFRLPFYNPNSCLYTSVYCNLFYETAFSAPCFSGYKQAWCFVYVEELIVYYSSMNDYLVQALLFWCWDGNVMKKFPWYENVLEGMSCSILAQRLFWLDMRMQVLVSCLKDSRNHWYVSQCLDSSALASDQPWYLVISQKLPNPILVAIMFLFALHVSRSIDGWCQIVVGQNFLSHPWSITAELFYSGAMCKIVCRFGLTVCRCQ